MNGAAIVTDMPGLIVAGGYANYDFGAAVVTEIHIDQGHWMRIAIL